MRPDLAELLAYWQRALRCLDWRISIEYVRDLCDPATGTPVYGLCDHCVDNKTAHIQVRDPETPINDGRVPGEIVEETVIHEVSHLHFAPFGFRRPAEIAAEENAVWAFAGALAAAKGTPREARIARAMTARISALAGRRRMGGTMLNGETIKAALEALKAGDGNAAIEVLTQILMEGAGGGGGGGGDPPPPPAEMGGEEEQRPAAPSEEEKKPVAARPTARTPSIVQPRTAVQPAGVTETTVQRMVARGLDEFKRDQLLEAQGHVLDDEDLRFARAQPYDVVRRMVRLAGGGSGAETQTQTPAQGGQNGQRRAQRPSTPTRGGQRNGGESGGGEDPTGGHIDRLMRVGREEEPVVAIDPHSNRLMVSNLRPMKVASLGGKGK